MVDYDEISIRLQMPFRVNLSPKPIPEVNDRWIWCNGVVGKCGVDFDVAPAAGHYAEPTIWFFKRQEDAVIFALKWS